MRVLLPAVQDALQTLALLHRESDCYLTPHANWLPTGVRFPCLGIKDGGVIREELGGEMIGLTMTVELVAMTLLPADGSGFVGEQSTFALLDAAGQRLIYNLLQVPGATGVSIGNDLPSELFRSDNNQWIVKLVRRVIYTVERAAEEEA
jgi:hypothetical protein